MAEMETVEANELIGQITLFMMKYGVNPQEAKAELYMLMHGLEITRKCTEITPYKGNGAEDFIRRFIVAKTTAGLSPRTLKTYYGELRRIIFTIKKPVEEITTDDIRYYIARRMRDGVTKTTLNNERHYMSSFFGWLLAEELIPRNPMKRIEALKDKSKKENAFSDEDIEVMRTKLRTWREKAIFETLLSTGCRVSELVSIKIDDITDEGSIYIIGKGGKYRNVYLNAKSRITIREYLQERRDENQYLFPRATEKCVVMACKNGKMKSCEWYKNPELVDREQRSDAGTIETIVRNIGKRAGVEHVHPHRFRRTCATHALRSGMPLELVSKMLGHESVATTQIYLDLNEDDLRLAHKKYVR